MINARVAELLREPAKIQPEDLRNIASEIGRFPYAQSLRALQLYGVHKFETARYNSQLSETAAYTANKKNLYQLINGTTPKAEVQAEKPVTLEEKASHITPQPPQVSVKSHFNIHNHPGMKRFEKPEPVFVNGKLNRILFKGEENFMNEPAPVIDIEVTKESGTLVVQPHVEPVQNQMVALETETENVRAEDAEIPEIKSVVEPTPEIHEDDSQLSFHRTEDFLPKVEFKTSAHAQQPPGNVLPKETKTNRHEEEMQRLIAEVEAKMKAAKAEKQNIKAEDEAPASAEINFAETAEFSVSTENSEASAVNTPASVEENASSHQPPAGEWKPMSLSFATPDALSDKDASENVPDVDENKEVKISAQAAEERPVIKLSFFSQEVSPIEEQDAQPETKSNIPQFVNTWQNWLKLGKKDIPSNPVNPVAATETHTPADEIKSAIIEKFIENEPKISRFNEDSTFTVRERGDDISHLMTETLANLYVEQRLYTKAIRAFGILLEKHPDRAERYKGRIEEIKALRQK